MNKIQKRYYTMSFHEVISLISSDDDDDDDAKKKSAVPAVPEVISLLSSDDESNDENPHSMVARVATYPPRPPPRPPPPPHITGLVQWDPDPFVPANGAVAAIGPANGAVAAIGDQGDFWIDPTDPAQIEYDATTSAPVMVVFTVQGKPSPLRTTRFTKKWFNPYNPSATKQTSFLKAAKAALSSLGACIRCRYSRISP
jgi:hypothetical protein